MDLYLHCLQGTSDKAYSISLRPTDAGGWAVLGWNGKWGATMIPQFKFYRTESEARKDFADREKDKRRKGYLTVTKRAVWPNGNVLIDEHVIPEAYARNIMAAKINWAPGAAQPNAGGVMPKGKTTAKPKAAAAPKARPSNLPAIPAWILSCFSEIPPPTHDRAVLILSEAFPADAQMIELGANHPEDRPVDWMRAIFARLQQDARKNVYRRFSIVLHPDQGGSDATMARWNDTYKRFAA